MPANLTLTSALARLGDGVGPSLEMTRPAALEYLGVAMANRLAADEIDLVVTWDRTDDATLGHVVARELAVDAALVFAPAEGQLTLDRAPTRGQRIALVGLGFSWRNSVRAPIAFITARGARVVRVAALVDSSVVGGELEDVSTFLSLSASAAS